MDCKSFIWEYFWARLVTGAIGLALAIAVSGVACWLVYREK